jgi:hypothetical protein
MTLNLIDDKMIVRNTIELQPQKTYVSASVLCSDLNSLEIESHGVYGQLNSKISSLNDYTIEKGDTGTVDKYKRSFLLDSLYDSSFNNFVEIDNKSINFKSSRRLEKLNFIKNKSDINSLFFNKDVSLSSRGLIEDDTNEFKFGVEKVKQKYLVDDKNYYKKKSVKNLYRFYRENMKYRTLNTHWGFSNYNCLNFFNITNQKNTNKTHRNCLAYPNPYINSSDGHIYNFFKNGNEDLTISFYINQNNKNIENHQFNPGCVLFIPGVIGIYVVKGTQTDSFGLTDSFRLLVVFGDNVNNKQIIQNFLVNLSSLPEFELKRDSVTNYLGEKSAIYLSKDNILNYNNWHNVTFLIKRNLSNTSEEIVLELFVDSKKVSLSGNRIINNTNNLIIDHQETNNSFICVGNKFDNFMTNENDISLSQENLYQKLFSINSQVDDDQIGSYTKKHISFGNNLEDNHLETGFSNLNYSFKNNLFPVNDQSNDYMDENTSYALSAELHDIRIYNRHIRDIDYIICKNNLKDFSKENVEFCLPVLYYNNNIKKSGIVNLNGTSSDPVNISEVNTSNLLLKGPVNHYFSNKCLGHEVNVENFVVEFSNKVSPNIIFNDDINSDQNTFKLFNSLFYDDELDIINLGCQKGLSINEIYFNYLKPFISNGDFNFIINNEINTFYFDNYLEYRNNFILPCDNGLQNQNKNNLKNYYQVGSEDTIHNNEYNELDLNYISLNSLFDDEQIFSSNNLLQNVTNPDLNQYYNQIGRLRILDERDDFNISSTKKFKENYDNFMNLSLNNFFREDFDIRSQDSEKFLIKYKNPNITKDNQFIEVSRSNYLKDLSNPVTRKINDDYSNSVASHLPNISTKKLSLTDSSSNFIPYYKQELPFYNLNNDKSETFSKIFCISTQIFGKKIEKESVNFYDPDLRGTFGSKKINLKDNGKGTMYRADSYTKHADWNYVGHCLYNEGIITVLHPSLENFGECSYKLDFKCSSRLNVLELNLPAYAGRTNKSYNESYIKDLRLNESAFNSDEDFVYITDINLHDENLNVVAKAKVVKPYPKKDTDNVLFRLKMDY